MIESGTNPYYLPIATVGDLATWHFAKLNPVLTQDVDAVPFTVLDCFDQSLRRSGQLLMATGSRLELLRHDGRVVSQAAQDKARFVTEWPDGPVKHALTGLVPLRGLLPVVSGDMRQATLAFVDDEGKTHCRARFLLLTTEKERSGALITLQGIKGYNASLRSLRERIQEMGGSALSSALYDELFPAQVAYDAKPEVLIASDATAFDAANSIIATYIPVARANESGIVADHDTEFLHDYRIQLRKIRSVLSLFKGVYDDGQTISLKSGFSALMMPTGRMRDLDVYLLEKQRYYDLLPESLHGGLDMLFSMFEEQREAERATLARHLRSKAYKQEMANLAKLFVKPDNLKRGPNADLLAQEYACDLIWKRYRKVCKIAVAIGPDTDDVEIHELRIHCKKLRYLMEFFNPVFPKAAFKSLLKPLKGLQDNLGLFNDYSVQQESLHAFLLELPGNQKSADLQIAQSVGALIAVLNGRQLEERATVMKSFARFNSPETQQTFGDLFKKRNDKV